MSRLAKTFEYAGRAVATVVGGACATVSAVASFKMAVDTGVDLNAVAIPATFAGLAAVYLPIGLAPRQTLSFLGLGS